jgi:hypothetical protein
MSSYSHIYVDFSDMEINNKCGSTMMTLYSECLKDQTRGTKWIKILNKSSRKQ